MSTPSVSISELANRLRDRIVNRQLTLNESALGDQALSEGLLSLLAFVDVKALTLAAADVQESAGSLLLTGRASFFTLTDLAVQLTVTEPDGGVGFSLRTTPPSTLVQNFLGFPFLTVGQMVVKLDVVMTASTRSFSGSITGNLQLAGLEVPISVALPRLPEGFILTGSSSGLAPLGAAALAGLSAGLDLSQLPAGLGNLLTLRAYKIVAGTVPYFSFTLASTQPWELVPAALSFQSLELFIEMYKDADDVPPSVAFRIRTTLQIGTQSVPILLTKDDSASDWVFTMASLELQGPGMADLVHFFGGAQQLESSMIPGLHNFGALTLSSLQMRVDPTKRLISSLSLRATPQDNWSLPLFGGVSFGQPALTLGVQNLEVVSAPPLPPAPALEDETPAPPVPYLLFKIASAQPWEIIAGTLRVQSVDLFVGATLATANNPRSVEICLDTALQVGTMRIPVRLTKDGSSPEWILGMNCIELPLPSLDDLAHFFGGAAQLESMMPGLSNFGALSLTGLKMRIDPAQHTMSSLSFSARARNDWSLPQVDDLALRRTKLDLTIQNPLSSTRTVTGSARAVVSIGGFEFYLAARKDSSSDAWRFEGYQATPQTLSLTDAVDKFLHLPLPSGVPDISFADLAFSMTPHTGEFTLSCRAGAPWVVPIGPTNVSLSNVRLAVKRRMVNGEKKMSVETSGDLAIGGVPISLLFKQPGEFSFTLPAVTLSNLIDVLGGGTVLHGLGLPASFFALGLGASTITIDVTAQTASIITSGSGFEKLELHLRRDVDGSIAAALALEPARPFDLHALLGIPGMNTFQLEDLALVLSSFPDSSLHFSDPAFAGLGTISRGFSLAAKLGITSLELDIDKIFPQLNIPTTPVAIQVHFGSTLADFTISIALAQPGSRIVLDQRSGLALIDPELRLAPGKPEFGLDGGLEVVLHGQKLEFKGGFMLTKGHADLYATLEGDWHDPFGFSGVIARNLSMDWSLTLGEPPIPSLAGTLIVGRQSGTLAIKPDPTAPVLIMQLEHLDFSDLLNNLCDPALSHLPEDIQQTLTSIRIDDAELYFVPVATDIGAVHYDAGVKVAGKIHVWDLEIGGFVQTAGVGLSPSLSAGGAVEIENFGHGIVLAERFVDGQAEGKPNFSLTLSPAEPPQASIQAAVGVLGIKVDVDIELKDSGFSFTIHDSGPILGGSISASLTISGGRPGPNAQYGVEATVNVSSLAAVLNAARDGLDTAVDAARAEISNAEAQVGRFAQQGKVLQADEENIRATVKAERDQAEANLKNAENALQNAQVKIQTLNSAMNAARAAVVAERAALDQKIAAAERDVANAEATVNSLTGEINSTDSWFHSLPVIDWPWKDSQTRDAAWYGLKMAGLYVARGAADGVLDAANWALHTFQNLQDSIPVDDDPRVVLVKSEIVTATELLTGLENALNVARAGISLIPIDLDPRIIAIQSLEKLQSVQVLAARGALEAVNGLLGEIKTFGDAVLPQFDIISASFSGELGGVASGKVKLSIVFGPQSAARAFTIDFDLLHPLDCIEEIIKLLLGKDHAQAIAAAKQCNTAASDHIIALEHHTLTNRNVTIKSLQNNSDLFVYGPVLHYGDSIWLQSMETNLLLSAAPPDPGADFSSITPRHRWIVLKPDGYQSFDDASGIVHFGDTIMLVHEDGRLLAGKGIPTAQFFSMEAADSPKEFELWRVQPGLDDPSIIGPVPINFPLMLVMQTTASSLYLRATQDPTAIEYPLLPQPELPGTAWMSSFFDGPNHAFPVAPGTSNLPNLQPGYNVFTLTRNGDWVQFSGQQGFLQVWWDQNLDASLPGFANNTPAARFRLDGNSIFNEGGGAYLRHGQAALPGTVPWLTCSATSRDAAGTFQITAVPGQAPGDVDVPPRQATPDDQALNATHKTAIEQNAVAANAPAAVTAAATRVTEIHTSAKTQIAPVKQAKAQAEVDRSARRQRTSEKAAIPPRDATAGTHDRALRFDGKGYLEAAPTRAIMATADIKHQPVVELGASFTIEAWIRPEAFSQFSTILGKWPESKDDEILFYLNDAGSLGLAWHNLDATAWGTPGWTLCQSEEAVKLDAWSHVAAVRDLDTLSLYIDGRRVGGMQGLGNANNPVRVGSSPWRIGASRSGYRGFVGLIGGVRIWKKAQSAAALRAQRFVVSRGHEDGLAACWNFDEPSGDTAFDSVPSGLQARLIGSVQRASPGRPEGPPLADQHMTLSGGAYAAVGNVDLFADSNKMSIETWLLIDQISEEWISIFTKWAQSAEDEYTLGLHSSGKLSFAWQNQGATAYGTPGWNHVLSDGTVPLGRWCHVALVRDGRSIRFYCDGNPIGGSDASDEQPLRHGTAPVCIGSELGQRRFLQASLAELRVWRRALTQQEVSEHHQRPLAGDEPGLAALWRLDEGAGSIVRDATSGGHHGTLSGPVRWLAHGGPPRVVGPTRGLHFTGSQYIEFDDANFLSPGIALTIETWIQVDAITEEFTAIVSKWPQSSEDEYMLGLHSSGKLTFAWHNQGATTYGTPGWSHVFSEGTLTIGRLTHVAVVRGGKTVTFYIDGQPAGSLQACDLAPFRNGTRQLRIGGEGNPGGRYLRGTLAGLRIFRTARTPQQIGASMSELCNSRTPGRILDLRFDEGEGAAILDTASGQTGQIIGTPLPSFVPVTLPVRVVTVSPPDPQDIWLQPALETARHCHLSQLEAIKALPQVEAVLQKLGRYTNGQVLALLAKAGYTPAELSEAVIQVWGHDAAAVARHFFQGDRPAKEALVATDIALRLAAGVSHSATTNLVSAAGYTPESVGPALFDVWSHEARAVAQLYREAPLPTLAAARAVWETLRLHSQPCFPKLVQVLGAVGYPQSQIKQALHDHFGCDESTIERAMQRSGLGPELNAANSRLLNLALAGAVALPQPIISDQSDAAEPWSANSLIIPGNFSGTSPRTEVLVYQVPLGKWCLYRWDATSGFVALGPAQFGWGIGGWIIPIQVSGSAQTHVLFYNPSRGEGQVFVWNAVQASMEPVGPLMTGWSSTLKIIPGNFVNPTASQLLFYDFVAGVGTMKGFDAATGLVHIWPDRPGWRTTWQIAPLTLPGFPITSFLLYDPTLGEAMVCHWDTAGGEASMTPLQVGWRRTWNIVPAHNSAQDNAVLFHDTASGQLFCFKFGYSGGEATMENGWVFPDGSTTNGPATLDGAELAIYQAQIIPGDFSGTGREFYFHLPRTSVSGGTPTNF